jgi:hypothetical protein
LSLDPISKEEYNQNRSLPEFRSWVETMVRVIAADLELLKRSRARASDDVLLNKFFSEAVPLWMYFKNRSSTDDVDVALSFEDNQWDAAIIYRCSRSETKIQITTTFCERWALTLLHQNEYGDAPITHEVSTGVDLAKWKRQRERVKPIAVDARSEVERELELVAERIRTKTGKGYPEGMMLFVYSYLDFTEEHFNADEMRAKLLSKLEVTSLDGFAEIYLGQPRRNIQIK